MSHIRCNCKTPNYNPIGRCLSCGGFHEGDDSPPPMTTEDLLKPRYKVIADYPGNVQHIGHIHAVIGDMASTILWCNEKDKYPHLFKKLEWHEERTPEEMPEYVKCIKTPDQKIMPDMVLKIREWCQSGCGRTDTDIVVFPYTNCFVPATHAEYEQDINKIQSNE